VHWQLRYLRHPGVNSHLASPFAFPSGSLVLQAWVMSMDEAFKGTVKMDYNKPFHIMEAAITKAGLEPSIVGTHMCSPLSRFLGPRALAPKIDKAAAAQVAVACSALCVNNFWQSSKTLLPRESAHSKGSLAGLPRGSAWAQIREMASREPDVSTPASSAVQGGLPPGGPGDPQAPPATPCGPSCASSGGLPPGGSGDPQARPAMRCDLPGVSSHIAMPPGSSGGDPAPRVPKAGAAACDPPCVRSEIKPPVCLNSEIAPPVAGTTHPTGPDEAHSFGPGYPWRDIAAPGVPDMVGFRVCTPWVGDGVGVLELRVG